MLPADMRQVIMISITVILVDCINGQCVNNCPDGTGLLFPLSYNTMRSHVFNGTQPSNEGCTNGVSIDGQVAIDCGQGTTLIDCNRGFNGGDYSDLSDYFIWNRTASVDQQVSIVFRFDQQISISRITMFIWNSQSNSIIVPNVMMYWSNDDTITPSNVIAITPGDPNRDGDDRRRLNVDINSAGLQFQYLRIVMSFYDNSEWIFLSDVQFCGNTAPFHITQPSTDNDVQIVSPTATMATLTCSLNVTIPSSAIVSWTRSNANRTAASQVSTAGSTTTLTIENLQSSDDGVYQCMFNDAIGSGWILRRNIILLITVPQIIQPPDNSHTVTFDETASSVQLMCSLNIIDIPSNVTVTWTHNSNLVMTTPPNEVLTAGNTTTLVIGDLQPSDAGLYRCTFRELGLQRLISLDYTGIITATTSTTTNTADTATATTATTTTSATVESVIVTSTATTVTTYSTVVIARDIYSSITSVRTITSSSSPTPSASSDDNSSSVGVIVALVVVVFIIITVVVVGIIVVWKRKKSEQHTNQEGVYYTTIDETIKRSPANKPGPVYSEMNDGQDSKEPQYMDVSKSIHSTNQPDKVTIQNNPAYSISSENKVKLQDNPAYSISSEHQVKLQDNPAYSTSANIKQ